MDNHADRSDKDKARLSTGGFIGKVMARAAARPGRIVFPEGNDRRIQEAARIASEMGIARITLICDRQKIGSDLPGNIELVDSSRDDRLNRFSSEYMRIRQHKGVESKEAHATVSSPLGFAAMMVRLGYADGTIGGAVATTADTIRTALQIVGTAPGVDNVSTFMIMVSDDKDMPFPGETLFADCALNVEPTAVQLASIGMSTADSAVAVLGKKPIVAFLSFSTQGSGTHPRASVVREAVVITRRTRPDISILGEIQFDAAIDAEVRARKMPSSRQKEMPNVYVFPNLDAANIGYKIAERIGGLKAVGPVLQGMAKPANDLSRGCRTSDILALTAITSLQTQIDADGTGTELET